MCAAAYFSLVLFGGAEGGDFEQVQRDSVTAASRQNGRGGSSPLASCAVIGTRKISQRVDTVVKLSRRQSTRRVFVGRRGRLPDSQRVDTVVKLLGSMSGLEIIVGRRGRLPDSQRVDTVVRGLGVGERRRRRAVAAASGSPGEFPES
jgi:hypothetical protein